MGSRKDRNRQDLPVEELINRVCSEFANKIETTFNTRFDDLQQRLDNIDKKFPEIIKQINSSEGLLSAVVSDLDSVEQFQKRNALRIHGLNMEQKDISLIENVLQLFAEHLHVKCCYEDLDSVIRIDQVRADDKTPSAVVVNFVTNIKRNEIFNAKKHLKNKKVAIFEDLTKKRYQLLLAAKKKFGPRKVWSMSGKIYWWNDQENKKCIINNTDDLLLY